MITSTLYLTDGRSIEISITDDDEVTIAGDVSRLSPGDAGTLGQDVERAAVVAGQRAARKRIRALASPRLTIEQVAAAIDDRTATQLLEPPGVRDHEPGCSYRRSEACDCEARQ